MKLTTQQNECFQLVKAFFDDPSQHVFILRGYAGTGKTFLMNTIANYLHDDNKPFLLMAPTGRAAKVLRSKIDIQEATTIHRAIYSFSHVKVTEKDDLIQFIFPLSINEHNAVCLVDEASMISSRQSNAELFQFGSGVLLDDLLNFAHVTTNGKVIFVGDPMQLPPVGDNESNALTDKYFEDLGISCSSFELTDVVRQDKESTILKNAMAIRDLLPQEERNQLVFAKKEGEVMDLPMLDVPAYYCNEKEGASAVICFSNAQAHEYNSRIRNIIFPDAQHVEVGDKLMVVNNSYSGDCELLNGDIITVVDVADQIVSQSAPIWKVKDGKKVREVVTLAFRKISFQIEGGSVFSRYIHEALLDSHAPNLGIDEIKAMYINTVMRIRSANPELKEKSDEFVSAILQDEFYNALQVKYGYAFTCHKSQGGEWDTVFVDFNRRTGLDRDSLRWKYTAVTRTKKKLWCVGLPNVTPLSSLKVHAITKTGKMASDALSFANVVETPYHPNSALDGTKVKYWSVAHNLEGSGYSIQNVTCKPYRDVYSVDTPVGNVRVDCIYNGAGAVTRYETESNDDTLLGLFKDEENITYNVHYDSTFDSLESLYNRIVSLCDELGIVITNIVDKNYKVTYYLKTSGTYAALGFTYNAKGFVTFAAPLSDLGTEDTKLNLLIDKLK